jgi:hypothetical protein
MSKIVVSVLLCPVFLMVAAGEVSKQRLGSEGFYRPCEGKSGAESDDVACMAYLGGFLDALKVAKTAPELSEGLCLPDEGVSAGLLLAMVRDWMLQNPDRTTHPGVALYMALLKHYPCDPKAKPGKGGR